MIIGIKSNFSNQEMEIDVPEIPDGVKIEDLIVYKDENEQEEVGRVLYLGEETHKEERLQKRSMFLRKVTANDYQKYEANQERAQQASQICKEKIMEHKLDMHLMSTVYSFDGAKINFIFTADERVDFRELVKGLAQQFRKQIHLQQIGPRDKAKIVTGKGKCGRYLCCSSWLGKLESISMDMARIQNIANKGSEKLSGVCNKLLCCLKYEYEEYKKLRDKIPLPGSIVVTEDGEVEVLSIDILNESLKIKSDGNPPKTIYLNEIMKVKKPVLFEEGENESRNSLIS